ncbi:MAG: LysR substrate-binding domain-containing protein [Pseudomonadota bacterium]
MDLRHLRYFATVAEELSFTRAAERLHISQPPLSLQIRKLEEELQVELFQRGKHGVALTEPGRALLVYAHKVLGLLDDAAQHVAGVARGEAGTLAVGFVGSTGRAIVPRLVRAWRARRPGVRLALTDMSSIALYAALDDGSIQVALVREPQHRLSTSSVLLQREPMCLVLPHGHPLATLPRITAAALQAEPMLMCSPKTAPAVHDKVQAICAEAGFVPDVLCYINAIHALADMVAAGLGFAILPQGMQGQQGSGDGGALVFRPIQGARLSEVCAMARADATSVLVRDFLAVAREEFGSTGEDACGPPQGDPAVEIVRG